MNALGKEDLININLALLVLAGIQPKPAIGKAEIRTLLDLSDKVEGIIRLLDSLPPESPAVETSGE